MNMTVNCIATSPSVSKARVGEYPPFIIIGNPTSARVAKFQEALAGAGQPAAQVIAYADLLAQRVDLATVVTAGAVVRIESPDRDFAVEREFLRLGAVQPDEVGVFARLDPAAVATLVDDTGEIRFPRQWFLGYRAFMHTLAQQLAACPSHRLMNEPHEIATMFDKPHCHQLLSAAGIPVAPALDPIRSYAELRERMAELRYPQVFLKLAHGSSASGVVAYRISGSREQAITTAEIHRVGREIRLFNNLRVRAYHDHKEIAALIDLLCQHRVHVERWLPKAGFRQRTFDLRVVVIGGAAYHAVVRLSQHPMTNLHLSAGHTSGRLPVEELLTRLDPAVWAQARASCEEVMRVFPRSLYAGIDLLITADYRHHAIAEVNAFGDLLYNVWHEGKTTFEAEIAAMRVPA